MAMSPFHRAIMYSSIDHVFFIAVCISCCRNGGRCIFPGHCSCPSGWTGRCCEEGMEEMLMATQKH